MAELDQTSKKALRQSLQEKLLVQQQCDDLKVISEFSSLLMSH